MEKLPLSFGLSSLRLDLLMLQLMPSRIEVMVGLYIRASGVDGEVEVGVERGTTRTALAD